MRPILGAILPRFCRGPATFLERGLLLAAVLVSAAARAQTDLLPDLDNPKLRFGTGKVVANRPEVSPLLPRLPGPPSGWMVAQWQQAALLGAEGMRPGQAADADPVLGRPQWVFPAPDGHAHLSVYHSDGGHFTYGLYERDGVLRPGGGSNLFLSADTVRPAPTLARPLSLSLLARVSSASIVYGTPSAESSGAVLGMAFAGLVLQFPGPARGATSTLFLQIPLANSRNSSPLTARCTLQPNGGVRILAGGSLAGVPPFRFAADPGPLRPLSFPLGQYARAALSRVDGCIGPRGRQPSALGQVRLSDLEVKGVYIGLETQNRDLRPSSRTAAEQGHVALGIDIAAVHLREDPPGRR